MKTSNLSVWQLVINVSVLLYASNTWASCNCESTDAANPCTGNSISVTVTGEKAEDFRKVTFNWGFESNGKPASCGQFTNGDYWVAPAAGENSVTFTSMTGSGSGTLFVDENPQIEAIGFLTEDYGNKDSSQNITNRLPLTYGSPTSLVGAIERNISAFSGCGTKAIAHSCVDAYNVLTVLDQVPENAGAETFRPNITWTQKDLLTWDDFDIARLPNESYFDGTDASGLESIRSIWSHHIEAMSLRTKSGEKFSEGGRAFRADLVTDDYAATVAQQWHKHMAIIMSDDHPFAEKKQALASMITYGKDIYHGAYNSSGSQTRTFGSGAGQWLGRFPAAAFFAAMVKDPQYGNVLSLASSTQAGQTNIGIHEMDQLNVGPNGPVWGDANEMYNQYDLGRYWGEMLSNQAFDGASGNYTGVIYGKKTFRDPYYLIDGPGAYPGYLYASVSAGPIKAFAAEMLLIPELCEVVNYDAIVDYAIRITKVGIQTANDSCAPPDPREVPGQCSPYHATGCKYYGLSNTGTATWGPDPNDLTKCIQNGTDPITGQPQNGRFASRHGEDFSIGYSISQIEQNWNAIQGSKTSCRAINRPIKPENLRKQ